ncbi:MAG TPA: delta(1)-pyrroline-2-carboxylate reductase family protein [Noviherbaspirillum sp.]|jgi:1-piperideine-2-carboxylate/1-pyrroline-2-carboxylate reductase [NAD(P)H]|uniref:delta(1)-pyrroline-2-carboxylate reductase family protein n=1 Tax=Noviherbaspirillum sp. TaxID=1926288 RepID=UPI002DDCB1D8|nr:delta(1)-pyrroline-2-carboxylate reductase family protein [Noviherbaspirillum sp.]HEV2611838.1 delta(1)-pyrroline-2-carboxylate reductase family protein [Noviherbaspirillum sp.]
MHIYDAARTAHSLPYTRLVPAVAQAAQEYADGRIAAPERQVVPIEGGGVLLAMPAIAPDIGVTKLITVHGDNARHGLPAIQGEVIVFDSKTGQRRAILDGPTVTARRTAAVTLLGIQLLAPAPPASALLIGSGVQAAAHADALIEFFGVSRLYVASRNEQQARAFCDALRLRYPQALASPIDANAIAARSQEVDVLIALTTSTMPVIPEQLPPSTMAIGVGAFKPEMAEIPAGLLHARGVVVDHLAGARHEAGDLLRANIDWNKARDLASIIRNGITIKSPVPVLKTVGHAVWDLAAARVAVGG